MIAQKAYIDRVLKRFNINICSPRDATIAKCDKFSKSQCPKNDPEKDVMKPYAFAIGSLMYAQVCRKPNIAYVVSVFGRFRIIPGMYP